MVHILQGLCEVVTANRGMSAPVITLFTRLLAACLDGSLSRRKAVFRSADGFQVPEDLRGVPLRLSQLISIDESGECAGSGIKYREHPVRSKLMFPKKFVYVKL